MKPVVIYGNSTLAKQVYLESQKYTSDFQAVAFCVSDEYMHDKASFCGLPLISESDVLQKYPPNEFDMLSCIDAPTKLRNRLLVYNKLKELGYYLRNFISPKARLSEDFVCGENNIVFSFAKFDFGVCLGHSNTIRALAVIGHDISIGNGTNIGDGTIIGSHTNIGNSCWLGFNCTVNDRIKIADDTLVASGAVILSNTEQGFTYIGNPAKPFFSHKETGIMMKY